MATREEESAESVRDVLTASRWSRALFTSYSFSAAFFEGFLLPKLDAVGCSEVYVLVDEQFYLQSLSERQSLAVGKSYRLYPVSCAGSGIFHPKLTYLWGDEYDLIAVGSGNLTYAGHGTNLECLDYASSQRESGVFADFGDFLEDLLQSSRIDIGDCRKTLSEFAKRASIRGRAGRDQTTRPRLLHSMRESVGATLVQTLDSSKQIRAMVCVSPFHHPQGDAVVDLARALGAKRVDIGLDPNGLRAPFDKEVVASRGLRARFVLPDRKDSRSLHAKWYEFRGLEDFVLTGSVNATNTSLWSTDNVEVALLRPVRGRVCFDWIETEPKRIEAHKFLEGERTFDGVITGVLGEDGCLRGRMTRIKKPAGQWAGELVTMLGRRPLGSVEIQESGSFVVTVDDEVQELDGSIQLRLRRGKEVAGGWIELTVYLDEATDTRGARLALARLSRGEAEAGDVEKIVQWLSTFIEGRAAASSPNDDSSDDQDKRYGNRQITYEDYISESANPRHAGYSMSTLVRRALVSLINGQEAMVRTKDWTDKDAPLDLGDSGPKPLPLEEFDIVWALIKVINQALARRPEIPIGIDLAFFKAEHGIRSALGSEIDQALPARAMEWVGWATAISFPATCKILLEPIVLAMAGCAAKMAPASHAAAWLSDLRELLRRYVSSWSLEAMKGQAAKGLEHRIFRGITSDRRDTFLAGLDAIWGARTYRDDLDAFVEAIRTGGRPQASPVLEQTLGHLVVKALLDNARNPKHKFFEVDRPENVTRCPGCGLGVDSSERADLRRRRGMKCRGCSKAILALGH